MRPLISATIAVGLTITAVTGCERTAPAGPDPDGSRTTAAGPPRVAGDEILTERWTRLPDSPLSPRDGAAAAHVRSDDGDLAIFIGGYIGPPSGPIGCAVRTSPLGVEVTTRSKEGRSGSAGSRDQVPERGS